MTVAVLVLPWWRVTFGSVVGPVVGLAVLWAVRERDARSLVATALGVCGGTWLWNTMLNVRHAGVIDGDVPFRPFPISWQDTGTGVFAFAFAALVLLATTGRTRPGARTLKIAGIAALAALVMDIYTW